ncbi:MAG: hypothetical protein K2W82_03670 [Candidatus Obscuribacterales bacterium]|nr:hypothetical protein [Candidatus Obscuribacterales bacterium]
MITKYMKLIERCPLLPIESDEQHKAAMEAMDDIMARDSELTPEEVGYAKILVKLIQEWETVKTAGAFRHVPGNEILEFLLEQNNMTQVEAASIAGISKQKLNDFLKGRQGLTKEARTKLANRFKLKPEIFDITVVRATA